MLRAGKRPRLVLLDLNDMFELLNRGGVRVISVGFTARDRLLRVSCSSLWRSSLAE
jgi:hypothetical protein